MRWLHAELPHLGDASETERPLIGPGLIWVGGVILPILLLLYGIACIAYEEALIVLPNGNITLRGLNATFCGIGLLALAGVLHCQCYWDGIYGSTRTCARRKLMCLALVGVCVYAVCLRMLHLI